MSPRELAYKILKNALSGATYSNIAIDNALKKNELSPADAGLLTAIVMGVTERRLTLDYLINKLSSRPDEVESDTRILLQMGIYQVTYLDRIPEYAAVNETVSLAPRRSRGFVNAIMREYLRRKQKGTLKELFPDEENEPIGFLSIYYSFPQDVCERFLSIYGLERTKKIFEIFNRSPKLTLRINTLKISREDYARLLDEREIKYTLSERLENAVLLENVSFGALPGFEEGYFFVQDEASQTCVEAIDAKAGMLMIDACSCPGSKSFGSAIKMKNEGKILSFDLHESKLSLISKSAERLGIDIITAAVRDGRNLDESLVGQADRVLCDVPCSGLGVLGKKPDLRYKDQDSIDALPALQLDILRASVNYLKAGGEIIYSTCTLNPQENEEVVRAFLAMSDDFAPIDFTVGGISSEGGMLTLLPHVHRTDGFFVAKLRKIK